MMILNEELESYKIFPSYEIFYIDCIKSAAASAIFSWERLNEIVSNGKLLIDHNAELIGLSENIINQAGIISRFFFPTKDKRDSVKNRIHELRGERLKLSYKIENRNVLKNRKFRNYIEHFDENLDSFLNLHQGRNIVPRRILLDSIDKDPTNPVFKAYVVNEFKLISLDQEVRLFDLIKEIYRIYNLSIEFIENGERLL